MSNVIANVQAARPSDATYRNTKLMAVLLEVYEKIGQERILEMWDHRGSQCTISRNSVEDGLIRQLWHEIPSGGSCWMDAFYILLQTARANVPRPVMEEGSTVCYRAAFLRSIGVYTGNMPQAIGIIQKINKLGETNIAEIEWAKNSDKADLPGKVNIANLALYPETNI